MAELAHRRLVRHRLIPQVNARKLAHHRRIVQRLLHRRVRQVEPLLQKNKSAASAPPPPAAAPCPPWDTPARLARTTSPTAPPAPSPPETMPAASSCCTARSRSSSPVSSASCFSDFSACSHHLICNRGKNRELIQSFPNTTMHLVAECAVIQAQVGSSARSLRVSQSRNIPRAFGDDAQGAVYQERPGARGVKKILASGAAMA